MSYVTLKVLTKVTYSGYNMEYKNITLKFTLQTQTKYKNTKTQTCLHEIFLFSHHSENIYRPSVLLPKFRH